MFGALHRYISNLFAFCLLLGLMITILPQNTVEAASFTAIDFASLQAAINNANDEANNPGPDTINITGNITLTAALPNITSPITIEGGGFTISGANTYRVLDVQDGDLTLNNVTIANGSATQGGGVFNNGGTLTITSSTFAGNSAPSGGGGVYLLTGTLTIQNSTFSNNSSANAGGAFYNNGGSATINNTTFSDNTNSSAAFGGTIRNNAGTLNLRNSIIANSTNRFCYNGIGTVNSTNNLIEDGTCSPALSGDPDLGILTGSPAYFPLNVNSPAIDAGDNATCLSTDQDGTARPQGGTCDIGAHEVVNYIVDTLVDENDGDYSTNDFSLREAITLANGTTDPVIITLSASGTYTLGSALPNITTGIRLEGGNNIVSGDNTYRVFYIDSSGDLTLNNVTVANGKGDVGAGVFSLGALTVQDSTFSGNSGIWGGGINIGGGTATIENTTFTQNTSTNGGAGVRNVDGIITINNSTFSGNTDSGSVIGSTVRSNSGTLNLRNSIVMRSGFGSACFVQTGTFNSTNNLINDGSCSPTLAVDPNLGALTGSPAYFPLNSGSPAIDAGDNATCLSTDQRGVTRPQGTTCDIGAYEARTITISGTPNVTEGNAGTTNADFAVTASSAVVGNVVVNVSLTHGTTSAADFGTVPTTVTILNGQTAATLSIPIAGDTVIEDNETFSVNLTGINSGDAAVTAPSSSNGSILDDDSGTLTVDDISLAENGTFEFIVTSSHATADSFTVDWAVANGTTVDADFTGGTLPTGGTLTFAGSAGETQTFTVPVLDDPLDELDETFIISLSNVTPNSGTWGGSLDLTDTATGTITDNDTAGVSIVQSASSIDIAEEGATSDTYTVVLNSQPTANVTVGLTADNTQITLSAGNLVFTAANWNVAQTVTVTAVDDLLVETDLHVLPINHNIISTDPNYSPTVPMTVDSIASSTVNVNITDNDERGIVVFTPGDPSAPPTVTISWILAPGEPIKDYYHIVITRNGVVYVDEWVSGTEACNGVICSFTYVDKEGAVILDDGTYFWEISGWSDGDPQVTPIWSDTLIVGTPIPPDQPITGIVVSPNQGQPTISWDDDPDALWWHIYVGNVDGIAFLEWIEKTPQMCDGTRCSITPINLNPAGGTYQVYIQYWGNNGFSTGGIQGWSGPGEFSVSTIPPQQPDGLVSTVNGSTPTLAWNGKPDTVWYQVWIGQLVNGSYTVEHLQWHLAADLGCQQGGTCTLTPNISLAAGDYLWAIQSWGPGGFNGGDSTLWTGLETFTVSGTASVQGEGIPFSAPYLTWEHVTGVEYYHLWIGTPTNDTLHIDWYETGALGCDPTCTFDLTPLNLSAGNYQWAAQVYAEPVTTDWSQPIPFSILP